MPQADEVANARVDASIATQRSPVDYDVRSEADLQQLRELWARDEAIPVIVTPETDLPDNGWLGLSVRAFLRGEQSGGRFSAHAVSLAPGAGLRPHYFQQGHTYIAVLDGEVELQIGATRQLVSAYTLGYCPAYTRQGFRNNSDRSANLIIVHAPAGMDRAFAALHQHWVDTGESGEAAYEALLTGMGVSFDDAELENDGKTNQILPPLEFDFQKEGDLDRIRELFLSRPAVPRLVSLLRDDLAQKDVAKTFRSEAIRGDDTAGNGMINFLAGAPGMNAPPHYQPTEDEFFFILEGGLFMTCGAHKKTLGPGSMAYCPKNCTHAFINNSPSDNTFFFTLNSPAGHERALETVRNLLPKGASPEEIDQLSRAGGFIFKTLPEAPS